MFETVMHEYFFQFLLLIVCAAATAIGFGCRKLYKRHIDSLEKEAVAFSAAAFVEQTFKDLHGIQKLQEALKAAEILLASKGIRFSAAEMKILIEAAVGQFNDAFNREDLNGNHYADSDSAGKSIQNEDEFGAFDFDTEEEPVTI